MKKYIDVELLKAEILKLRSGSCISESDDFYEYAKSEILDIIDTLQQEQPEVDLKNEIEEHVYSMPHCEFSHYTEDLEDEDWARAEFHHFYELGYELGLNARKEE